MTDITYLPYNGQHVYLSAIKDLFSKEIDTMKKAIKKEGATGVLIHSDQGFQYTSHKYKDLLQQYQMKRSMSRRRNCLDNACMENFFSNLKAECLYLSRFSSRDEWIQAVHSYIQASHGLIGFMPPGQA